MIDGPRYVELPRVRGFSVQQFQDSFAALEQPIVLEDFAEVRRWPVFSDWSLDVIAERYGNCEVSPRIGFPDPDDPRVNPFTLEYREYPRRTAMTVREFVQVVKAPESAKRPCYLQTGPDSKALLQQMSDFVESVHFDEILRGPRYDDPSDLNLWIGSCGTRAGFHQDDRNNFVVQIEGRKRVYLGAPSFTPCFYPFPGLPDKSQVAPERYEPDRFPLLRHATILHGEIRPTDVLFIPRGWWHTLRSLEPNIMLNRWHGNPLTKRDFDYMYQAMPWHYQVEKMFSYARCFAKTSANLLRDRHPLDGLSVWYSPGTQAAVDLANWSRRARHRLTRGRAAPEDIPRPFLYP
jgi:hypothetical protein